MKTEEGQRRHLEAVADNKRKIDFWKGLGLGMIMDQPAPQSTGQGPRRAPLPVSTPAAEAARPGPASSAPLSDKSRLEVYLAVGLTADERAGLEYLRDQDLRLIGKAIALAGTTGAPDPDELNHALGRVALADDVLEKAPNRGAGEQV